MKVVVVGAEGMLAQDLIPIISTKYETISLGIDQLDITDKKNVFDVAGKIRPDLIVNCAAYNLVDQAETDRKTAFFVNAYGVQQLALACQQYGIALCHFSTDYVFDGQSTVPYQPHDQPRPINVYGESKRAGELFVQSILNRYYIIRTSSLYGKHGDNFVYAILRLAKKKEPLRVVQDQRMSPTWTVNLARGVLELISSGLRPGGSYAPEGNFGVYHLTDQTAPPATTRPERAGGGISWFEFAGQILKEKEIRKEVVPTTSQELMRPATRPAYSVLDTGLFTLCCGYEPLPWQESLRRFIDMI